MDKKRGQISIELVITIAFAFLITALLTVLLYEHSYSSYNDVNNNQAALIARKITDSADSMYYLGYPSSTTLKVYMPENIEYISIYQREVVFRMESGSEIVSTAKTNLTGNLSSSSGLRYIKISAMDNNVKIQDAQP
ncbi:hypothetical protein GF323_01885 [Candidatus Woesearchaeota archaeon]|nr:hypothetical protein [Candidatus Woesearchaeota archaeon]